MGDEITLRMALRDQLLGAVTAFTESALCFVERKNGNLIVRSGKEDDFKAWEQVNGGFRRHAIDSTHWTKQDEQKFLYIERDRAVSFYVRVEREAIKIYPPRHLCV